MKKILTSLDLNCNEIQNFVIQKLATDPGPGISGRIYYNTTDKVLKIHNGTDWEEVGAGASEITRLPVNKGGTGLTEIPSGHLIMGSNEDRCSTVEVAANMSASTSDGESSIPTSGAVVGYVTNKIKDAITNATLKYKGIILADGSINSTDSELSGKKINELTSFEAGWIFKVTQDITDPVTTFGVDTKVSSGDVVMVISTNTSFSADNFAIMNRNIDDTSTVNCVTTPTSGSIAKFTGTDKVIESSTITEEAISAAINKAHTVTESTSPVVVNKSETNEVSVSLENIFNTETSTKFGENTASSITSENNSFNVPEISVDTYGRVTSATTKTLAITYPKSIGIYSVENEELTVSDSGIAGWVVTHSLDTMNPIVQVYESNKLIIVDVSIVTKDSVAITITDPTKVSSTISANTYKVVVMG